MNAINWLTLGLGLGFLHKFAYKFLIDIIKL